ncbi:hypothetical protein ABK040_010806 [Willaertia magna]
MFNRIAFSVLISVLIFTLLNQINGQRCVSPHDMTFCKDIVNYNIPEDAPYATSVVWDGLAQSTFRIEVANNNEYSQECKTALKKLICFSKFKLCKSGKPPQQPCKSVCDRVIQICGTDSIPVDCVDSQECNEITV